MGSTAGNSNEIKHSIPIDILDDLCSRFIINLPPEDRDNLVRICFQIELAHWFYLDYYCTDESNNLNPCGIREFAAHIFHHVPQLRGHASSLDAVLKNWREYKQSVPTYGAILLDTDLTHVLLVQSYWTKASWGFPKGKVNQDEEPWICAAREVYEETGFDISKLINKNDYIEAVIHDQIVRLYLIGHIPRDTKFQPRTRNEIKACEWFPLADLPANKKDMTPKLKMGVSPNAFFMVLPFVKRMRRWVAERNPKAIKRTRHKSMGEIEASTSKTKNKPISQGLQNEITDFQNLQIKNQEFVNSALKHKHHNHSHSATYSVLKDNSPDKLESPDDMFFNFIAPSWANFKFDKRAILDCLT
ncbi:dcp2, box A domain-containing protein [Phthorimaea operculella]|nr:dcp2, box A domain-containing protein [Phthorimaea operculella]